MPGTDPATLSNWLPSHLIDPDAMSGTDGVAVGPHNGYDVPAGGYSAPVFKANAVNGHASLLFESNGTAKATAYSKNLPNASPPLNSSGGAFPAGLTVFAVVKPTALVDLAFGSQYDRRVVLGMNRAGQTSGSFGLRKYSTTTSSRLTLAHGDPPYTFWSPDDSSFASYPEGAWCLVGFRSDGTDVKSYKGISQDRIGTNPSAPTYGQWVTALCLGADLAVDGRSFDGEVAYFGVVGRKVTDGEWASSATYLLDRFGLPLREITVEAFTGLTGKDVFVSFHGTASGAGAYLASVASGEVGYRVNGGPLIVPAPIFRPNGDNNEFSCDLIALPTSSPITAGQVVTVTVPAGAVETTLGIAEEVTDLVAANNVGAVAVLAQAVQTSRTMKVAYNLNSQGNYFQPYVAYRNLFKAAAISNESGLTIADDGTVTSAPSGVTYLLRATEAEAWPGYPGAPYGRYQLQWEGPVGSTLSLVNYPGDTETVVTHVPGLEVTGAGTKKRYYDVTAAVTAPAQRALFSLVQSAHAPLTAVWVGLEADYSTTLHFSPLVTGKLLNCSSVRFMDAMQTNFANCAHVDELTQVTDARYAVTRTRRVAISRVESYDGAPFWPPATRQFWKVTTAVPHGLATGQTCKIKGNGSAVNVTLTTRGVVDCDDVNFLSICVIVLDSTSFAFAEYAPTHGHKTTVTPWTTAGAEIQVDAICGMPVEMMAALCDEADAEFCHVTFPHCATDATVTHLAGRLATSLPAGTKLRLELSNEPWNSAFSQFVHWCQETVGLGGPAAGQNYVPGYAVRAFEVLALAREAFAAASRPSSDVGLVLNVQNARPEQSASLAARVALDGNQGVAGVTLCTAPYLPAVPHGRLPGVDYSGWTLERMMDYHEAYNKAFDSAEALPIHRANLDAAGLAAWGLATYECQNGFMGFTARDLSAGLAPPLAGYDLLDAQYEAMNRETIACSLHPRMYGITAKRFSDLQAAGAGFNTIYNIFHGLGYEFTGYGVSNYGDYPGLTCLPGRGDGSDGGVDNRPRLVDGGALPAYPDTLNLASVRGLVALDWAADELVASFSTVATPRDASVPSVVVTFVLGGEAAAVVGVGLGDFSLTRGGSSVSLSGASLSGSGSSRTLSNLDSATGETGDYVLTLSASGSGIESEFPPPGSEDAVLLRADASVSWTAMLTPHRQFSGTRRGRR